ncbi:GNAT family N-acetyltransferase [Psychrilyobacter sp.]|uniref:GNAT family N-acetyltransferase n=1 Tax=Psychrilyobacter sp. TaxID=2586924 RepID=UPI003015DB6B
MKHLKIRIPLESESEKIFHYVNHVAGETKFLTFGKGEYPLDSNAIKNSIRNLSTSKNSIMLIAELNNKIIGLASIKGSDKIRMDHVGDLSITILKDYWGQGIGKKMIDFLLEWARNNEFLYKVNLKVRHDNLKAIKIYKDFGFTKEGILLDDFKINNTYYNHILMGTNV